MGRFVHKTYVLLNSITLPFSILMGMVLLVFQPWFLQYEYSRSNFPPDQYGFSYEDRIQYGTASLLFITKNHPKEFLSNLTFDVVSPIYNQRELDHMMDVQVVFRNAKRIWIVFFFLYFFQTLIFFRKPNFQLIIRQILTYGSQLTIVIFFSIFFVVIFAFDPFFQFFHQLFFTENSWLFYENDTLIRLFPEKLWIDGFLIVSVLTIMTALIFFLIGTDFSIFKKHSHRFNFLKFFRKG